MLLRAPDDKLTLVHEQVVPLVNTDGRPSGLHLTQWFPGDYAPSTDPEDLALRLTPRQIEIAGYFASGLTAAEVAQHAGISSRTARDHLEDIYSRLEVHSRSQLVLVLVRAGLIQPGRP